MARSQLSAANWQPPLFQPVRTSRTYEEAVGQIAEAVRIGEIQVGQCLPSERTLAQQMGISRPTLREAIRALADAGVLQTRSSEGTVVCSDVVPLHLVSRQTELKISEVAGVLEARRLLEPRVAQLAALRLDDDDVARLRAIIDLQRTRAHDQALFEVLELRFHLAIARAAKNATVFGLMRSLLLNLEIARDMAMRFLGDHFSDPAIDIHERTLKSLSGGDPDDIEVAMDEHLSHLENIWEEATGRARLRRVPDFLLPRSARSQ
ncbi:MAG: FCD domain-containing protein [Thermoleophilia bacterium]|nr:FCD domain-containing protein [Thermoleophilia bacterium]